MPVRSLNSAVLKWPDLDCVLSSARSWAQRVGREHSEIRRILCFGSAAGSKAGSAAVSTTGPAPSSATGGPAVGSAAGRTKTRRWGVGSDLDIFIELTSSESPFICRSLLYAPPDVSVPVEILVYTAKEIARLRSEGRRFIREVDEHSLVLYKAPE